MKLAFALVAVSALAFTTVANADARMADCSAKAKEVTAALEAAQPGSNTDAARAAAKTGRDYCGLRLYAQGVAHYSKALELLGKN